MLETVGWDFGKLHSLDIDQWAFIQKYSGLKQELNSNSAKGKYMRRKLGMKV